MQKPQKRAKNNLFLQFFHKKYVFIILYYNGENDIFILESDKMARKKSPPKKKSRVSGEIKKLQRSTDLLIRKAPFCRLVKGKWLNFSY